MGTSQRLEHARKEYYAKSNKMFILLIFCLLILIACAQLINSSLFTVGTVEISGNKYISDEDIKSIAGIPEKINIFRLSTDEISKRLLADLRIEKAEVSRLFPATIAIYVTERQPAAFVATNYGFVQVDKQGIVLAAFKNLRDIKVPIITGVSLGNAYVGDKPSHPFMEKVLLYLSNLDEFSLNELSEVNVTAAGELTVYTLHSGYIRLGNFSNLVQKAKYTSSILRELREKNIAVEYIDLTFASPYIKFKQ